MRAFRKFAIWLYHLTGVYVISLQATNALAEKNFKRVEEILEERSKIWPGDPLLLELHCMVQNSRQLAERKAYLLTEEIVDRGLAAYNQGNGGKA